MYRAGIIKVNPNTLKSKLAFISTETFEHYEDAESHGSDLIQLFSGGLYDYGAVRIR